MPKILYGEKFNAEGNKGVNGKRGNYGRYEFTGTINRPVSFALAVEPVGYASGRGKDT